MLSVIACLRYEIVIPLPKSDQSAANLVALALFCLAATVMLVTVATIFWNQKIAALVNSPVLAEYLWLLSISVASAGAYSVFQYWATRKKAFAQIARTRVERSIVVLLTQLTMGLAGAGATGLIIGQILSNGAGLFSLARRAYGEDHAAMKNIRLAEMKRVAYQYDKQPKYSTLESLTNNASVQLPILLISSLTSSVELGNFMLAMQTVQAPMSLIGSSVAQVYLSRAVENHRKGQLGYLTARTISGLVKIGVGPLLILGIIAPFVFGPIFGEEWKRAGELVAWMTPWFLLQFLVSPVSMSLYITNNQRTAMMLQVMGLILRVLMVLGASNLMSGRFVIEAFALSGAFFYIIYLWVVCKTLNLSLPHLIYPFRNT